MGPTDPIIVTRHTYPGLMLTGLLLAVVGLVAGWAWQVSRRIRARRQQRGALDQALAAERRAPGSLAEAMGTADLPARADVLGFKRVAQAIAGLLRNDATGAPYSVVVSGNWGSGKSSVMLQVQQLLTGSKTVWFNVWHYQSGQHLLNGFLRELLQVCQSPAYQRQFRRGRFLELGLWASFKLGIGVFLLGPVALYLGYRLLDAPPLRLLTHLQITELLGEVRQWLTAHSLGMLLAPFELLELSPDLLQAGGKDAGSSLPFWSTLLAWVGTLLGLVHTISTQGAAFTGLLPVAQFDQAAARADSGFRDQYRQDFRDALRHAPDDLRIVFFIDDVDRIPGPRIIELLESLNYLVEVSREARAAADALVQSETRNHEREAKPGAIARLYFVLGMYVPEVVNSLASALNQSSHLGSPDEARRHAAHYLEKMVDLVVPMPRLARCAPDQVRRLLFGAGYQPVSPSAPPAA